VTRAQALLLPLLLLPAVDLDETAALLLPHRLRRLRRFFRDAVFLVCRACSLLGNVVSGLDEALALLKSKIEFSFMPLLKICPVVLSNTFILVNVGPRIVLSCLKAECVVQS
jgi:hypothetical protein